MTEPDRMARPERPWERGDRPERPWERGDRPERPWERGDRPERPWEREDRPDRAHPSPTAVVVITGIVSPDAVGELCRRVRALLEDPAVEVVTCDLRGVARPDAVTLEALARMQLTARRLGRSIRLLGPCPDLRGLLALAGLTDIIGGQDDGSDGGAY